MEKRKLAEARNLIQQKEYTQASKLLETMLDNDTAMKWYLQVQQLIETRKLNKPKTQKTKRIVLLFVLIIILIVLVMVVQEQNAQSACEAAIMLGRPCR